MKCQHQFRIVSTEIHDQRKVYHLKCSLCQATRRRNRTLKRFHPKEGSGQRKHGRTSQQSRKCKILPRSLKRQKQEAEYSRLKRQFLKDNPICQFQSCKDLSTACHHKRGREGPWLTDTSEFMAVCQEHHDWIELNREQATAMGYLKLRLTTDQLKNHES